MGATPVVFGTLSKTGASEGASEGDGERNVCGKFKRVCNDGERAAEPVGTVVLEKKKLGGLGAVDIVDIDADPTLDFGCPYNVLGA